jgi:hypothetical protein
MTAGLLTGRFGSMANQFRSLFSLERLAKVAGIEMMLKGDFRIHPTTGRWNGTHIFFPYSLAFGIVIHLYW